MQHRAAVSVLSGDSLDERSASSAPLPLPASVASGQLMVGADGLYVLRVRRG
jgi:hypothetical protein